MKWYESITEHLYVVLIQINHLARRQESMRVVYQGMYFTKVCEIKNYKSRTKLFPRNSLLSVCIHIGKSNLQCACAQL